MTIFTGTEMELKEIAEIINSAKRPIVYVGSGVRLCHADDELLAMRDKADLPVTHTSTEKGDYDSNDFGTYGLHKDFADKIAAEADVLIVIGISFNNDQITELAKGADERAVKIQMDIDRGSVTAEVPMDYIYAGDIREVLVNLLPLLKKNTHKEWKERINAMLDEGLYPYSYDSVFVEMFGPYAQRPNGFVGPIYEEYKSLLATCPEDFFDAEDAQENRLNLLRLIVLCKLAPPFEDRVRSRFMNDKMVWEYRSGLIKEITTVLGEEVDPDFVPGKTFVELFGNYAERVYRCLGSRFQAAIVKEPEKYVDDERSMTNLIDLLRNLIDY